MRDKKIGIIGCGNMGEAILSRLLHVSKTSASIVVSEIDTARRSYIQAKYKIIPLDNNLLVKFSDVVILAVKPKDFDKVLTEAVCSRLSSDKLLISIAAGITTKYIERIVGEDVPVIRAMPNMGAMIGEAISTISAGGSAGKNDMKTARDIFSVVGDVVEVDEDLVDSVTAISGSGPAYFFYLVECLIEAARDLGLERKVAKQLVLKTALGSSKLLEALKEDAANLRKKVTSKGGTTEAALEVFEGKKFKPIVKDACRQAYKRSKELSRR